MCFRLFSFLRGLDHRFLPPHELSFKKEAVPRLARAATIVAFLGLLLAVLNLADMARDFSNKDSPMDFSHSDPRTWTTLQKLFMASVALALIMLGLLYLRLGWFSGWNWELIVLVLASITMVSNSFNARRWALIFGLQPDQVYKYNTTGDECSEMLLLDTLTTGLCIFVPIRVCMLWVAPVAGLLMHSAMRAMLGSTTSTWLDVITLSILALLSLLGAFENERTARERFMAVRNVKVQEEMLSNQYAAMSRILARFCDCLLQLDGDFRFCGDHQQFAAIVFSLPNTSLDGGSFLDHLASGRDDFVEVLSKNAPMDQVSDMLPLLLKDSQGREFAAHAYCTCYEDRKGSRHYLIGITETQERLPQEEPLVAFSSTKSLTRRSSDGSEAQSEELHEVSDNGEISFSFLDDDDFGIISCSPGFTSLGGPLSKDQSLKDWMRSHELQRFSGWVQYLGNTFRQHSIFQNAILSPPHAEKAEMEYVAQLSVSVLRITDDSEVVFQVLVEEIHERRRFRHKKCKCTYKEKNGPLLGTRAVEAEPALSQAPHQTKVSL